VALNFYSQKIGYFSYPIVVFSSLQWVVLSVDIYELVSI